MSAFLSILPQVEVISGNDSLILAIIVALFLMVAVLSVLAFFNTRPREIEKVEEASGATFSFQDMETMLSMLLMKEGKLMTANRNFNDCSEYSAMLLQEKNNLEAKAAEREARIASLKIDLERAQEMLIKVAKLDDSDASTLPSGKRL